MTDFERKADLIRAEIRAYRALGKRIMITSSFQTHSIPLLHILGSLRPRIPVYFLNTNYHFPETLRYKDEISSILDLEIVELRSEIQKEHQIDRKNRSLHFFEKDRCCKINKVTPLESVLPQYDVWISGVRAEQTSVRAEFKREQPGPQGILRYHPMLDWSSKDIFYYRLKYELPEHPLEAQGYLSIGCQPCTQKPVLEDDDRSGRWSGSGKVECGLHTELVQK